ncbi:nitroreductase family protein [Halalkalibacter akibai]|uniref:Oxygen-insensitive NAD(P)H nitroreductase n=1 Tax=Halalkalibacter akibai (strain ATCC 43226 / DSM 21942 / CIP 109018 / JCM 9157 / 1139) TaxID=1236973 RepID=W4QV81_HALA3|nr:nitroreductase family protein [Halalkalibacter akibai]GAE35523.1 oxygen-insensitive NAD(P)H nitroreductase [Halalkalibacter akibai JCM 9157]
MATQTNQETLTVQEAIEARQSIRKFKEEQIPRTVIDQLFKMVRLAPSAWNLQPWRYHVITDPALKVKLQEAAYGQTQVTSAPAVIVLASDMEDVLHHLPETIHPGMTEEQKQTEVANLSGIFNAMTVEERGQWGLTQTNIALGFLLIAIKGLGYSSVPMLGFDQAKIKELLGISEHAKIAAMIPFGKQDSDGYPHHRFELDRIVTFH